MAVEVLRQCYGTDADPERRLPALSTYLGHTHLNYTYWYLHQNPSLMQQGGDTARALLGGLRMNPALPTFPALLQRFFTQRLMQQKRVSAHTIRSYRDTFRLLLRFAQKRLHTSPDRLAFEYSRFSSRNYFREIYLAHTPEKELHFLRRGRGVSFHEFELFMAPRQDCRGVSAAIGR